MKKIIIFAVFIAVFSFPLFSAVTSVEVRPVGTTGQYIEAGTENNPVLHIVITAPGGDTLTDLSIYNSLNSWYVGSVSENSTIADNGIKVWYSAVDTNVFSESAPVYVTHLPRDMSDGAWWYNTFSQAVTDGSHIWVTADIQQSPVFGTIEMQTENLVFAGSTVTSVNEPASPSVLLVTSVTPAQALDVLHEPGLVQSTVSTSQPYVTPMEINLFNNSPDTAADITVNFLRLKVLTYPAPGSDLPPSSIISSIRIQDKDQGTIYGEIFPGSVPAFGPLDIPISQMNIPAGTTTTVNVTVTIADNAAAAGTEFMLALDSGAGINGFDYYTQKPVIVQDSAYDTTGFPMYSKQTKIQKKAGNINAWYTKVTPEPQNINKGDTNVAFLYIGLENPGDTNTASAEVYNLKLYVESSSGLPLIPRDLFSKISITDESGNIKYRVKTTDTIESSGNTITFPMSTAITIDGSSRVTVAVKADISASTVINSFRLKISSASDITCVDKNSFSAASVSSAALPFYSSLALLSSSFTVSHTALMPPVIYKGQQEIHAMDIAMTSPLSFGNGNILVRGISLTAKNASGQDIQLASVLSGIRLETSGQSVSFASIPAAATGYFAFPREVTVTAIAGETISVFTDIKSDPSSPSVQLQVAADTAISAYQDNDPVRQIFIAAAPGDAFPMSSGTGFTGGDSLGLSFSPYPVPFSMNQPCRMAYYLSAQTTVTITVYDMTGGLVRTVLKDTVKAAGSHSEDTWDGTDKNGRSALSGTYILRIDAGSLGSSSKKVIFIK